MFPRWFLVSTSKLKKYDGGIFPFPPYDPTGIFPLVAAHLVAMPPDRPGSLRFGESAIHHWNHRPRMVG